MDIALILSRIRPNALWRMSNSYENLVNTWEDTKQKCPTQEELSAEWEVIQNESIIKYCYYNNGILFKNVDGNYVAKKGEILFISTPTPSELTSAFPSVAGTITHTITTAPVAGDTVTIQGVTLTSPSDAAGIATALNSNTEFATYYTASASGSKITVTEKIAGNLKTPTAATYTGTVVISSSKPTSSVYGYKNAMIAQQLVALNSTYVNKMYPIERGLVTAYANKNTDTVTALESTLATIQSEYKTKAQAIIDG